MRSPRPGHYINPQGPSSPSLGTPQLTADRGTTGLGSNTFSHEAHLMCTTIISIDQRLYALIRLARSITTSSTRTQSDPPQGENLESWTTWEAGGGGQEHTSYRRRCDFSSGTGSNDIRDAAPQRGFKQRTSQTNLSHDRPPPPPLSSPRHQQPSHHSPCPPNPPKVPTIKG